MLKYSSESTDDYFYVSYSRVGREEYVEEMLKRIGKTVFARYYYEFKRLDSAIYTKIEENYSDSSKRRRTAAAINLIRQGLAESALLNIARSRKTDPSAIMLARSIYSCEFRKEPDLSS